MNVAARLNHLTKWSVAAASLCHSLHWLSLAKCIQFKLLTKTYKAIHNSAPSYITNLTSTYWQDPPLNSFQDRLLSSSFVIFSRTSPELLLSHGTLYLNLSSCKWPCPCLGDHCKLIYSEGPTQLPPKNCTSTNSNSSSPTAIMCCTLSPSLLDCKLMQAGPS